jgi:RimJ/RimL family protein N-acetyltransferase
MQDPTAPESPANLDPSECPLFRGSLVRLSAFDLERDAPVFAGWSEDSRYLRQSYDQPVRPMDAAEGRTVLEAWAKGWPETVGFALRALEDDRLIGFVRLYDIVWTHGSALVGISVPAAREQGRGFGRDGLALLLRYAFHELGLHRLWLDVFAYNMRAIHLYERAGFREEGRLREHLQRDGLRWDVVLMGILRSEWEGQA